MGSLLKALVAIPGIAKIGEMVKDAIESWKRSQAKKRYKDAEKKARKGEVTDLKDDLSDSLD